MDLEKKIEAILFYKAEPIKKTALASFFEVELSHIESSLKTLQDSLNSRGVRVVCTDSHAQMVTAPDVTELIESMRKAELKNDIGKAGAETLAIILYRGPLSRVEIDRIRGVNSAFIIRNLLIRGLIERRTNVKDSRSFLYAATPSLLNHLGISKREELPDFGNIMNTLDSFESDVSKSENDNSLTS